jgi:hypothetical protein
LSDYNRGYSDKANLLGLVTIAKTYLHVIRHTLPYIMNSGKVVIIVIPSIVAIIFSVFVTIGIMADVADRAEKDKHLKNKLSNIVVLTPPPRPYIGPK